MLSALIIQTTVFYGLLAYAQSSFQLGYIPLAVKTPYLNAWIVSNTGSSPEQAWPNFYTTDREFGWAGFIRVDGRPFQWMGNSPPINFTKTVTSYITPTKSVFTLQAGPMLFNVTFLTPVEPNDYVRQSMPFSYMYIDGFAANDSQPHNVQVYSDISGQWVARNDATPIEWDTIDNDTMIYHRLNRQSLLSLVDDNNFAEDGIGYYAMLKRSNISWRTGADVNCRGMFASNGTLSNTKDTNFRNIGPTNWPVFAFAVDLGTISPGNQPDPVVSALGLVRDPLVTYTQGSSVQSRTGYYMSNYSTPDAAILAFLSDFQNAQKRNADLDNKLMADASAISPEYAGIVALATRQIFASMDITLPATQTGNFNTTDVRVFMKDMGQTTRANPVEVIYGALPALLYFNSSLATHLLEPLFEFQSGPDYPNAYAAPDLGASYPIVSGNSNDTHTLAVESSGSMLVMAYAHAVKTGDGSLLNRYYPTMQKWADYLVFNALHPPQGADGLGSGAGIANSALKGILGIYSMAKINEALSIHNTTYMDQATQLITEWKKLAVANNRIESVYGQTGSSGLIYNIFPAIWLNVDTSFIGNDTIDHQAQSYAQQSSSQYALDSSQPDVVFPHWTLLTAATIPSSLPSIRDRLISSVYQYVYAVSNKFPLPTNYKASNGSRISGSGSAIHGAAFGILALNLPNTRIQAQPIKTQPSRKTNVGAIVGGVIGGLAGLLLIVFAVFFFLRKRKQKQELEDIDPNYSKPRPFNATAAVNTSPVTSPSHGYQSVDNESSAHLANTNATHSPTQSTPDWEGMAHRQAGGGREGGGSDVSDTTSSLSPGTTSGPPPMSSKQREVLLRYHVPESSVSAVSTASNPHSTSASGAEELRAEVEQLRREMASIRHMAEPPPGYQ